MEKENSTINFSTIAGGSIKTYTGKFFNPLQPDPELICIQDIAHALSNLCRFGGHCKSFYSVAQHSVLASYLCSEEVAFDVLMHDASEAYMVDIPRPIKRMFPEYKIAEDKLLKVIFEKYNLQFPFKEEVHVIDDKILQIESIFLMDNEGQINSEDLKKIKNFITWTPEYAEEKFIQRFCEFYGK